MNVRKKYKLRLAAEGQAPPREETAPAEPPREELPRDETPREETLHEETEREEVNPAASVGAPAGDMGEGFRALIDANMRLRAELDEVRGRLARAEEENAALKAMPPAPDYAAIAEDEGFIADYAMKCEALRRAVVADYLGSLARGGQVCVLTSKVGRTPLTPVRRPKSLAEAKILAETLING